jgi:prepilin-type N-terminal cleavage/methylation domain-containing protein
MCFKARPEPPSKTSISPKRKQIMANPFNRFGEAGAGRRGFSIIELLVAVIIIGVLVSVIVPRLAERSEQAKRARVEQDLELIQKAQEQVVIDTSYMVRLFLLDDVRGGDSVGNAIPNNAADVVDSFGDEAFQALYNNRPNFFIDPDAQRLASGADRLLQGADTQQIFERLRDNETFFGWRGPYLTYQVDTNGPGGQRTYVGDDAWGNDYLMFTPEGLINDYVDPVTGVAGPGTVVTTITIGGNTYSNLQDAFDRFAILSLGPNGLPGDGTAAGVFGTDDDIVRRF